MLKNAFLQCFHDNIWKPTYETQIKAYAAVANAQHAEKRVFAVFSSSAFEIYSRNANKAYAVFANVQHAEKRVFALFSSSTFEIYSRDAKKGIRSIRRYSTCRKTRFCTVFITNF